MSMPMDQFTLLFGAQPAATSPFPDTSRYAGLPIAEHTGADGRTVRYVTRRFLPDPRSLAVMVDHRTGAGDRLDLVAARYYADPELFWRVCDGNPCLHPDELTAEPGRVLHITLPPGMADG